MNAAIAEAVAGIDLSGYATDEELAAAVAAIDLSAYQTAEQVSTAIASALTTYATESYVDEQIVNVVSGGTIELSGYVTETELAEAISEALSEVGEENVIESITIENAALTVTDKTVDLPLATTESSGLMSYTDKAVLDGLSTDMADLQTAVEEMQSSMAWEEI